MTRFFPRSLPAIVFSMLACAPAGAFASEPGAFSGPASANWNLDAAQIASSCAGAIAQAQQRVKRLIATRGPRTLATVVLPLEDLTADLNDQTIAQQFLFNVATAKDVRDASLKCDNDESAFYTDLTANPKLYTYVAAVKRGRTAKAPYQTALVDQWLDTFKRSGAGLSPTARAQFVKISNELTNLQNTFQSNLGNDNTTITISQAQAVSLPADFVATLKKDGSNYVVPVNESTSFLFLSNQKDESARKSYSFAYNNRAAAANTQLLERAIALRDHLAHLLGYQTWAAYQLSDRMAKDPQRVMTFLNNLDTTLLPKAREDVATLTALKAKDTGNPGAVLQSWDFAYYDNMLRKTQYAVDQNEVRQYFPVQHTIDSVLNIYHTLLGVDFKQISPANAWNPDVIAYTVSDSKTGRFIGTTYFDLYPRPGKYDHFANFPILPVRKANGAYRPPIAAIVGNWPKPAPGHPALLSHDDVVTFFHEFGHNLAALLATAPYETLTSGFRQDFVEAPSQMLENFMWQPAVLKEVSANVTTNEPLPDDLIKRMVAARYVNEAYFTTGQIKLGMADMAYHSSGPKVDTTAVWAEISDKFTPMPMVPGTHPQASFGHLFGYDAGYYSYLWALVYAQDMFTAFENGGLENPAVGARYRKDILEPARTYEPDVEVRNFLGRPMSTDAFYKQFVTTSTSAQATP